MTDAELIKGILERDENIFRQLVEQYKQIVFNTCYGLLHSREDAQDIAQDVFIEVYVSIDKFRHEAKLSTWLYRVSVNKSINHLKKNKKNRLLLSLENMFSLKSESTEIANIHANERDIYTDESAKVLYDAIDSLGENQRVAFTLNKFDELSYKEISEIMNISISSVESLIHRAKINLQKKLEKFYYNR